MRFGGPTRLRESVVIVGTSLVSLLGNNPRRVSWSAVSRGTGDITASFSRPVVAGVGFLLASFGGTVSANVEEDAELVTYELFAIATIAGNSVYVVEVERI